MTIMSEHRWRADELIDYVSMQVGDPNNERRSRGRVLDVINDVLLEIAIDGQYVHEAIYVRLLENVPEYDLAGRIKDNGTLREMLHVFHVELIQDDTYLDNPVFNKTIRPISSERMDRLGIIGSVNGVITRFSLDMISPGYLKVIPSPNADGGNLSAGVYEGNLKVHYVALPTRMTAETDYPDEQLPIHVHEAIALGAADRLLEEGDIDDLSRAVDFAAAYDEGGRAALREINTDNFGDVEPW
jgi:hypothetical protein